MSLRSHQPEKRYRDIGRRLAKGLLVLSLGGLCISFTSAQALEETEVAELAEKISVRIEGATQGTGTIIDREGGDYVVITAWHVVKGHKEGEELSVITNTGRSYSVTPQSIERIEEVDLAILRFKSTSSYNIAKIRAQEEIQRGERTFVSGYPLTTQAVPVRLFRFFEGRVVANASTWIPKGYQLLYSNTTLPGMSGGPALDKNGYLIGIHGQGEIDVKLTVENQVAVKTGTNQGIPIRYYLNYRDGLVQSKNTTTMSYDDNMAKARMLLGEIDSELRSGNITAGEVAFNFFSQQLENINMAIDYARDAVLQKETEESYLMLGTALFRSKMALNSVYFRRLQKSRYSSNEWKEYSRKRDAIDKETLRMMDRVLAINPMNYDALAYKGTLLEEENSGDGLELFIRMIAIKPDDPTPYRRKANALVSHSWRDSIYTVQQRMALLVEADQAFTDAIQRSEYKEIADLRLSRGMALLKLSELVREEGDLDVHALAPLSEACKDAQYASYSNVKALNSIWNSFKEKCHLVKSTLNDQSQAVSAPSTFNANPGFRYLVDSSVCDASDSQRNCSFKRQFHDSLYMIGKLLCQAEEQQSSDRYIRLEGYVLALKEWGVEDEVIRVVIQLEGPDNPLAYMHKNRCLGKPLFDIPSLEELEDYNRSK